MFEYIIPCVSITCIRFNGYNLSDLAVHPRVFISAKLQIKNRNKGIVTLFNIKILGK